MITYTSYDLIIVGLTLRILRNVNLDYSKEDVISEFNSLFIHLEKLNFKVSQAYRTSRRFKQMVTLVEELEDEQPLEVHLCDLVADVTSSLEDVVFAEALTKTVYVLPERRYNSEYLLSSPDKFLRGRAFEKLGEIAKLDITSACKCLLFGEATAAAFHILRATEAVLKDFYYLHRKQKRLAKPMWANMIEQLRLKKRNKPSIALLDSLDHIRAYYRNPTQHPQKVYDIDEAQDLFGRCLDAIGKMAEAF